MVTISIPVYNRYDLLKIMAASLYQSNLDIPHNIRIYDDRSTEFGLNELKELFPNAASIVINKINLKADKNIYSFYKDFLSTSDEYLFNADSDLIFNKKWLINGIDLIKKTDGVLTLFNATSHPATEIIDDTFCIKKNVGSAGTLFTRERVEQIVHYFSQTDETKMKYFDWRWSELFNKNNVRIFCLNNSLVQHIGFVGQNSSAKRLGIKNIKVYKPYFDYGRNFSVDSTENGQIINDIFEYFIKQNMKEDDKILNSLLKVVVNIGKRIQGNRKKSIAPYKRQYFRSRKLECYKQINNTDTLAKKMTITVDCRKLDESGIGVYLSGCLPFLFQSGHNFLLLGNAVRLNSFASSTNVKVIECNVKPFSLTELFFFPAETARHINKTDVYFAPFFNVPNGIKIPIYTTIHDLVFPDMPQFYSKIGLAARMWFFRRAYKKSKKIFTVSEFSKSRIEHHLGTEKPVIVAHSAIQPIFLEYRANIHNIQKKETVVFIGNIKKYKGLDCLLDAFRLARNVGLPHKLIIIGSKKNFRTSDNGIMRKIESIGDAVSFTDVVSDETLMEYLSSAALLVQPSFYEGFCIPPLEALVLGTHALISDIPVLKEIYDGYPVTFFRAGDPNDLKEKLLELLLNKKPSSPDLTDGLLYKYTYDKTVSKILKEFE